MPYPALLICLVVGIGDGDSLVARCPVEGRLKPRIVNVRIAGIDAPERGQAHGTVSREHLAALCRRRSAEIRPVATDAYRRVVASVRCDGTDVATAQVRAGLAWAFDRYPQGRALRDEATRARSERRGLWARGDAVPPWEWRASRRAHNP